MLSTFNTNAAVFHTHERTGIHTFEHRKAIAFTLSNPHRVYFSHEILLSWFRNQNVLKKHNLEQIYALQEHYKKYVK